MRVRVVLIALASVLAAVSSASSLVGNYFILPSNYLDTGGGIWGVQTGLVMSTLGPDGLPVASALGLTVGDQNNGGFKDVNVHNELLWWTAGVNGVAFQNTEVDTLPLSKNVYPNNSGYDGSDGFSSARWDGTFVTPAGGTATFNLGSDDDAWVFLNGNLIMDNGGIHGVTTAPTTVSGLLPGINKIDVFFADRFPTGAHIDFSADVILNPTPEPFTMGLGIAGIGFVIRRRMKAKAQAAG